MWTVLCALWKHGPHVYVKGWIVAMTVHVMRDYRPLYDHKQCKYVPCIQTLPKGRH